MNAKQEMINSFFDKKIKVIADMHLNYIRMLRDALMEKEKGGQMCPDTIEQLMRI